MIVQPPLLEAVGRREATIRHSLVRAAGFEPARLVALGGRLPPKWAPTYDASGQRLPFSEQDVLDRLASGACTVRLYHLELLSSFAETIQRCYDESQTTAAAAREGGVTEKSSIAFLGSAGATTKLHLDHHHNLLFQISGTKTLTVAWFDEPARQLQEVERSFAASGACTSTPTRMQTYSIGPGDGIYLPPYTFHAAEVLEGEISVALSCAFSTPATERAFRVHRTNQALSRLRLHPAPAGSSSVGDTTKDWLGRGLQRIYPVRA